MTVSRRQVPLDRVRAPRAEDERRHVDDIADHRALISSLVLVCILTRLAVLRELRSEIANVEAARAAAEHCAELEADRARIAEQAAERCMDALVAFDARCARGDVAGAVRNLRAGLARLRGGAPALRRAG